MNLSSLSGTTTTNESVSTVSDVFTASTDSNAAPRVYFYEKRPVGSESNTVYQRATNPVVSGKSYILVNSCLEGTGKNELTKDGSTTSVDVYSDGISYNYPYVITNSENEFVVTKKGSSYIFNNTTSGKFLTASGATTTLSSSCYLPVTSDDVTVAGTASTILWTTINGTKYYLYEKKTITEIDSDLVADTVTPSCNGTLPNNGVIDIRANDHWTSSTSMTVVGLISSLPSGVTAGNKFYAANAASGTMSNSLSLTNGTATLSGGTISYTSTGSGAETFYYVAQVGHLGAYMYGQITVGGRPSHTEDAGTITTPATCTEAGVTTYKCAVCQQTLRTAALPAALGHNWVAGTTVSPTCTTQGYTPYECSRCHATKTDDIVPRLGHSLVAHERHEATCTADGNIAYWKCSRCQKYFSDSAGTTEITEAQTVIPAAGHTLVAHTASSATCTAAGNKAYWQCSVCNKYFSDDQGNNEVTAEWTVIDALGHLWGEWTETTAPGCTTLGEEQRECSRCHITETRDKAALGHAIETINAKEPTCTETGNYTYYHCTRCGKYFSDLAATTETTVAAQTRAALGHDWPVAWTTDYVSGGLAGHEHRTCQRCGEYDGRALSGATGEGYSTVAANNVIGIYQIDNTVSAGDTYILVSSCTAGSANVIASGGTTTAVTVYSDGISYAPYVVEVAAAYERTATEAMGSVVDVNGTTYYVYKKVAVTSIDTDLIDDFAVIDFGQGFTSVPIRSNDDWTDRVTNVTINGIVAELPSGVSTNDTFYKNEQVSAYQTPIAVESGSVAFASGTISFTPSADARFETVETVYYGATVGNIGAYMYASVNIIPATTIYYEDTSGVITYTDGANESNWGRVGTTHTINYLFQDVGASATYGYSTANNTYYDYSAGSAMKVTCVKGTYTAATQPKVEFTFTGTGVTIFAATGKCAGLIGITIKNSQGATVKNNVVDTYFGYAYSETADENGNHWRAVGANDDVTMYQVPVLDYQLGAYDTYSVTVSATYSPWMDHAKVNKADFYFDGFRVYNPMGIGATTNEIAAEQYQKDGEYDPKFMNLRKSLTAQDSGTLFVDGDGLGRNIETAVTEYREVQGAPNNEIMLSNRNGVTFRLTSDTQPANVKVAFGAKVTHGGATATLRVTSGGESRDITISSGTEMYYNITDLISWAAEDGAYKTAAITITNYNDAAGDLVLVSLTNVKISSAAETLTPAVNFAAGNEREAWEALADIYGVEVVAGDVDGDGVVNLKDIALLKKYLAGNAVLSKYDLEAADVDGSGSAGIKDLPGLRSMIAG